MTIVVDVNGPGGERKHREFISGGGAWAKVGHFMKHLRRAGVEWTDEVRHGSYTLFTKDHTIVATATRIDR